MRLIRKGSQEVVALSTSLLRVRNLSGAALNDLVTIERGGGSSVGEALLPQLYIGRVVEAGRESCLIRICGDAPGLCRDDLRVWLGGGAEEIPAQPPRPDPETIGAPAFKTGIPPVDTLFPLSRGDSILLAGVTMHDSLPFISAVLRGALADGAWPCIVAPDLSSNESRAVRLLWNHWGLESEGLYISDGRDDLYSCAAPLRDGFTAALARADEGRHVFIIIIDLEAWFRFYQEDLVLRLSSRTPAAALNGFRSHLSTYLQHLSGHSGHITSLILLSERKIAGVPSPLLALRDLFDARLILRGDGSLSLRGYTPRAERTQETTQQRTEQERTEIATLLRRQCQDILAKIREKQRDQYPLTEPERAFHDALHAFLSSLRDDPSHPQHGEIWRILSLLPDHAISRIPATLRRAH